MIDLHSHILPGIDDGAPDWSHTLSMAATAVEDGIRALVCTPHCIPGCFDNRRTPILDAVDQLRERLMEAGIPLQVYPGSELRLDRRIGDSIESGQIMTLNDTGRYALIELPPQMLPPHLETFFWDLISRGVTPVIAHPERHPVLIHDPEPLCHWVEMGVLTQITAASLMGRFGSMVRRFSIELMEHGLTHILATDSHGPQVRAPRLSSAYMEARAILGEARAMDMIQTIPQQILKGKPTATTAPLCLTRRARNRSIFDLLTSWLGRLTPRG
ncbi:MAG: hypothetical protein MUF52_14925 [Syntrophobacteraceae bacterium]|jgi:protein-tyrosine phosphatase|nr:hypothetical protein [Syntrophobacteraceae bacterium]